MNIKDINDNELIKGSIFEMYQTINGENLFVVFDLVDKDIRYSYDLNRKYEYDVDELLAPSRFTCEVDFVIVGNIYNYLKEFKK